MDSDAAKPIRQACLLNAECLLNSAKEIRRPDRKHISFHLAALALEEIGKSSMVTISSLSSPTTGDGDADEHRGPERLDDHERKLFWAMFMPSFHPKMTASDFRRFQGLARSIHENRLSTLYVDPMRSPDEAVGISDEMLDSLLGLTEARLEREKLVTIRPPDEVARDTNWFLRALEQPQLRMIVLSQHFVDKLDELEGDYNKWIGWLRQRIDEIEKTNREMVENELRRDRPSETEADKPKWQLNIRLKSSSHSIRPKPLAFWNQHVDKIKLYNTPNKRELLVHFTMVKGIPLQALWQSGETISRLFVIALNIGSFGFFWWELPSFVSKYYDKILDLENKADVLVERNPPLVPGWKIRALKEPDLNNISVVFSHLVHADLVQQQEPYKRYFMALSLLAKTDVFVQFGLNVIVEFYESLRAGFVAYGEWDGAPETFEIAAEKAFQELKFPSDLVNEVKRMLHLAGEAGAKKASEVPITLDESLKLKTFCDAYFLMHARRDIQHMVLEDNFAKTQTISPGS
jgi:AbiV family abortive infection protein